MILQILIAFTLLAASNPNVDSDQTFTNRQPQSLESSREGDLFLINGTQGCPQSIQWQTQCNGFSIKPVTDSGDGEIQYFCDINDKSSFGKYRYESGGKKTISAVTQEDNVVHRHMLSIFYDKQNQIRIKTDDTLFIDPTGKILWEHAFNGQGFSCLFSK